MTVERKGMVIMALKTTSEVAAFLRCSERTVRQLVSEGRLVARRIKPRGQWLFAEEDVTAALEASRRIEGAAGPGRLHT
jgi:excisionase family DNA binding protein